MSTFGENNRGVFNGGMAKKKSGTQKKKVIKNSKGGAFEQLKRVKWYMWVLIALTVYFGGLYTFKHFATQHDIKLLDEAEAKMRQLDFGDATSVEFSRSCSVRSVKYGDPGKPKCEISTVVKYSDPTQITELRGALEDQGLQLRQESKNTERTYFEAKGISDTLECTYGEIIESESFGGTRATLYCYKEFWKQVYPEE